MSIRPFLLACLVVLLVLVQELSADDLLKDKDKSEKKGDYFKVHLQLDKHLLGYFFQGLTL